MKTKANVHEHMDMLIPPVHTESALCNLGAHDACTANCNTHVKRVRIICRKCEPMTILFARTRKHVRYAYMCVHIRIPFTLIDTYVAVEGWQ
jgi:hypothetical protein